MNIRTEYNEHICPRCGNKMYYDGRCGDGPVCTNSSCHAADVAEQNYWDTGKVDRGWADR